MSKDWKLISKNKVFDNPFRPIEEWKMKSPSGGEEVYYIDTGYDVVEIFVLTKDNEVLMLEEYFMSKQDKVYTLPAGLVEKGDSAQETAMRELMEETGYKAKEWVSLGNTVRGKYTTGHVHYFLALDAVKVAEQSLDSNEDIKVMPIGIEDFKEILRKGDIHSTYDVACAYRALDYLKKL